MPPATCIAGVCVGPGCPNAVCDDGENQCTCPADCPASCGDGCCSPTESCEGCAADCGACPILAGAGDIATCDADGTPDSDCEATALLLDAIFPPGTPLSAGMVFTAGDNAYLDGTDLEFANCYDPTWGRHRPRTWPTPGNHDYNTPNATGYFNYFGAAAGNPAEGWYAHDLGDWRVYALNSNCWDGIGECDVGSPQFEWLEADLEANPRLCQVAYWHHARWSSGEHGSSTRMLDIWALLVARGADLVLVGHDHDYERFAPLDVLGNPAASGGTRQIVVGTGGSHLRDIWADPPLPGSEVRQATTHGILRVDLLSSGYQWEFIPEAGGTFTDSGSSACH